MNVFERIVRWLRWPKGFGDWSTPWYVLAWRLPFLLLCVACIFAATLCMCIGYGYKAGLYAGTKMFDVDIWHRPHNVGTKRLPD